MQTKSPAIRSVIVASGAPFIAPFVAWTFANRTSTKPVRNLTVVYVDAVNCAPCETRQRNPGTVFLDIPGFHRLAYREVKSPNLFDVLKDNNRPIDDDLLLVDECNRAVGTATMHRSARL